MVKHKLTDHSKLCPVDKCPLDWLLKTGVTIYTKDENVKLSVALMVFLVAEYSALLDFCNY